MSKLRYLGVSKKYPGTDADALREFTLDVPEGALIVLLGPSGCGKTTLLRVTNRLIEPDAGQILLDGADICGLEPTGLRRRMGYVIQQVGLFPHMTVEQNIAVTPRLLGWSADRIRARVEELLELVHLLPAEFRGRRPSQLSGGQQQRVGLARALAADPEVLLMDEPFGALDVMVRASLQDVLLDLHRRFHKTTLFVTHDVDEALRLADTIAVIREGRLLQSGPPRALLAKPADDFVRTLLGADDRIRALGLITAAEAMVPGMADGKKDPSPTISADASLRDALSLLLEPDTKLLIVEQDGQAVGCLGWEQVRAAAKAGAA